MGLVQFQAGKGKISGYLSEPKASGPGILVLHAWWGLNPFFKTFCQRLAAEGFVALAPDLYRGKIAESIEEAKSLRATVDSAQALHEIESAADHLLSIPTLRGEKLGVVGFSLGAYWAMQLADRRPGDICAVVLFYGIRKGRRKGEFSTRAAFQGHFAEDDEYESLEMVRKVEGKIRAAKREATCYIYPKGKHWFMEENQPGWYDPEAAALAWKRTVEFLRFKLAT